MKRFKQFLKDLWKKEFWKFTFSSRSKKLRFFFILPLVGLAIFYCITELSALGWKVGGSAIACSWLILNFYQYYSSYYRCKYELGWDIQKHLKEQE